METINKKETKFWTIYDGTDKKIIGPFYLSLELATIEAKRIAKRFVGYTYIVFEAVAGITFVETKNLIEKNISYEDKTAKELETCQ